MQCDTPRIKGWERPNLVHNLIEKTFESKRKKKMIKQANNQTFAPSFTHNLKCLWCKLEDKLKRMLIKEWFCNLSEIFFGK